MKLVLNILLFILLINIITAQNETGQQNSLNLSMNKSIKDISEDYFIKQTNELLKKEIEIPKILQPITKWVIKTEKKVDNYQLITISLTSLLILIISALTLRLFKTFNEGSYWLGGIATLALLGILGLLGIISNSLIKLSDFVNPFKNARIASLTILIISLVAITLLVLKLTKKIKIKEDLTEAEKHGEEIGREIGFMKKMRESYKSVSKV